MAAWFGAATGRVGLRGVAGPVNAAVDTARKSIWLNGQLLTQPFALDLPDNGHLTAYMPIWYIGQALSAAGYTESWQAATHTWVLGTPTHGDFSGVPVGTGPAHIVVNGQLVKNLPMAVHRDPAAGPNAAPTTYMPIYYIQQILRAAGIPSAWDGQRWSIQLAASPMTVLGFVTNFDGTDTSLQDLEAHTQVNAFSTFASVIDAAGNLYGEPDAEEAADAASAPMGAYVTVANINDQTGEFDPDMSHQLLSNPAATSKLIRGIVGLVAGSPFRGVTIDFEMLSSADRSAYTAFLTQLSQQLSAAGKQLQVAVPGVTAGGSAYDLASIADVSNTVLVMAYDYSYPGGPAGAIAPVWWVEQVLKYTTQYVPASKILLGVPFYGYDWSGGKTRALSLPAVNSLLQAEQATASWDAKDEAPYFTYTSNGTAHTVYFEDAQSLQAKLALVNTYHLQGISIWHMDLEDAASWSAVQGFLAQPRS